MVHAPYEVSACPATGATSVNLSDSNQLTNGTCRALYVGVTGDIAVVMANGDSVTFTNVAVGVFPISAKQVKSTSTTASGLIALY